MVMAFLLGPVALAQSGQFTDGTWTLQELRDPTGIALDATISCISICLLTVTLK